MDIHMVSPRYHPKVGGIETHMTEVSLEALERGHTVAVHCLAHDRTLPATDAFQGIEIRRYEAVVELGYYTTLFRPELPKDAVVHLHAFGHWTNRWVMRRHPCERTLLTTHHGIEFPTAPIVGDLYYALYRRLALPSFKDLHKVITMNTTDRDRLVARGVPPGTIEVLPSGIHPAAFDEPSTDPGPDAFVLYVGRIHREKRVEDLVRIAPELDVPVLVAGPDDGDRARLETLARELGAADQVQFLGMVPEEEKLGLLRNASALALPSEHEGLGLVLMEAWAQGTPVVATRTDGPIDLVEHGENGFLYPPGDREALLEHLTTLIEDPSLAAKMGEAGREMTWEGYRWEALARRVVDLYEACPASGP